jgi:hypothetical protein
MFGNIDIRVRPLRLAFLVDPRSTDSLLEAIQINSTLWGGTYNPIIPLYKRTPATWADKPMRAPKADAIVKGYIEAFDPDVLVKCAKELPDFIPALGLKVVEANKIWASYRETKRMITPSFGVGVFELLNRVFAEHFRYKEKFSVRVVIPKIPDRHDLFWAAFLGQYPKDIQGDVLEGYRNALDIETVDACPRTLKDLLGGRVLFPRRITHFDLEIRGHRDFRKDEFLFFMDAMQSGDIIDYWNLRALGKPVLPVPKQLADDPDLRSIVTDFVNRSHRPHGGTAGIWNCASFVRGRHVTMDELQAYAKSLDVNRSLGNEEPFYLLQHWYPRIWDEWARDKDGAEPADVIGEEKSLDVAEAKAQVQFQTVFPKAALGSIGYGSPRCANEISFRIYGTTEPVAQVLPRTTGQNVIRAISPFASMPDDWRLGKNGLVSLVEHHNRTEHWDIPQADNVFFAWLKDQGWDVELSPPGRIAKDIFLQLEGFPRVFANENLLKLLEHMNGGPNNERELSVAEMKNRLAEMGPALHDYLISKKVFKIGVKVQCPSCRRNSCFSPKDIQDELACPKCLKTFTAIGSVDQGTWCYRTAGPFSIPRFADGAYCVLLALDFLSSHTMNPALTPSLCFTAKDRGQNCVEADFGALWRESTFGGVVEGTLFAECKTYGKFEKKDLKRMKMIAKSFPGAVLAFCTLRKSLKKDEIREVTKIAKAGRKYWKSERPLNPVLILTGNELFSMFGPPSCWKDMGLAQRFDRVHTLLDVCDATQQIYLKLPSWHETWREKWERRRMKRAQRTQQFTPSPADGPPSSPTVRNPSEEV